MLLFVCFFFFQAEDGIRDLVRSRGLGDVYKRQGLDGVINRIDPGEPLDKDIYDMEPEELKNVPSTPGSLQEALKALENDHEYLLKGDVFTEDVIETWIKYKMEKEVKPMALQPHPYEFGLYYDV